MYGRAFDTVEVDATFYAKPAEPVVRGWGERVPAGFVLSLKVPQEVTHERRLVEAETPLAQFVERARLLGRKLGPLLLQMALSRLHGRSQRRDALAQRGRHLGVVRAHGLLGQFRGRIGPGRQKDAVQRQHARRIFRLRVLDRQLGAFRLFACAHCQDVEAAGGADRTR